MVYQASIVIPAHNEESRIRSLLATLDDQSIKGKYAIFVVCNGCVDRTRDVAEQFDGVAVVEIADVGKHFALNEGDRLAASLFPRLYVDADARIDPASIELLVQQLSMEGTIAAGPTVEYDASNCSWLVNMYLRALDSPIVRKWSDAHLMGRGLYGANREARKRFEEFPPLIADDTFFDSHFQASERFVLPEATVTISTPKVFWKLIVSEARVVQGNRDLIAYRDDAQGALREGIDDVALRATGTFPRRSSLVALTRDVRMTDVVPLLVYVSMKLIPRLYLTYLQLRRRKVRWASR